MSTQATELAASLPLGPVTSGDSWLGRPFRVEIKDAMTREWISPAGILAELAAVVFQIHTTDAAQDILLERKSADSQITITSTTAWTFTIPKTLIDLPVGDLFYSIRCEDVDGHYLTVFKGVFRVTKKGVVDPP